MRKFVLMALAGAAIALAAPVASATPLSLGSGLGAAADNVASTEVVHHRRWHRRHHHRHHRWNSRRWR